MNDTAEALPPIWQKFGWIDSPDFEGAHRRVWADGSTLLAETNDEIGDFFERHPYFERAELEESDSKYAVRVWLKHRFPPEEDAPWNHIELPASPDLPFPKNPYWPPHPEEIKGREPDLQMGGYLMPGYDLFAVHPDVEALWYIGMDGDGPHPDAWHAKIWLKQR